MYIYWKKSNCRKKNSNEAGMLKILTNFLLFDLIFYFGHLMKNDLKKKRSRECRRVPPELCICRFRVFEKYLV